MAKNAARMLAKEFRLYGARSTPQKNGTSFMFPDGATQYVEDRIGFTAAHVVLRSVRERYDRPRPVLGGRVAHTHPVIDPGRLEVTDHAAERIRLMQGQEGRMRREDISAALMRPEQVRWSDEHGSWVWVGERVAVAATVTDGATTIRTVMWATEELWAENPRPQ